MAKKDLGYLNSDGASSMAGAILAAQLGAMRDGAAIDDGYLEALADLAIRATIALHDAIPRARERIAAAERAEADAQAAENKWLADVKLLEEAEIAKAKAAAEAAADAAEPTPEPVEESEVTPAMTFDAGAQAAMDQADEPRSRGKHAR